MPTSRRSPKNSSRSRRAIPRALDAKDLAKYLATFGKPVTPCETVADGVKLAVEHAGRDGVVLCYGSLYMLGDIKAAVAAL